LLVALGNMFVMHRPMNVKHEKGMIVQDMISTMYRWTLSAGAVTKRPLAVN